MRCQTAGVSTQSDHESPLVWLAVGAGLIAFAWIQHRYLNQITYYFERRRYGPDYGELRSGCLFYLLVLLGLGCMLVAGYQFLDG